MSEATAKKAGRNLIKTIVIILAILFVYAITVQVTDINLDKPLDPDRQAALTRVLRLLADPDIIAVEEETGNYVLSVTAIITIERIIETIFMALVASTIGTALAVPISFLAARNLMEDIVAPLASVMAAIIALPIGVGIGVYITSKLLSISEYIALNSILDLPVVLGLFLALLVTLAFLWIVRRVTRALPEFEELSLSMKFVKALLITLTILISIITLGLVATWGWKLGIGYAKRFNSSQSWASISLAFLAT